MGKYAEAKSQPDWMDVTARQIRGTIKATIIYSGIRHQNKDQVLYPLHMKIDEFVEEIEDAVLAQQFKAELYQYAEDLWQKTIQAVGNLTPFQFAQALTAKTYISDEQAQASFNLGETATRVATFIAESNGALAYGNATSMQTYNVEVQKRVKEFMQDLSYMSKYTDSAPNARNIAEMTLRYEKTQADLQELKGKGTKFVYIPPHANCSARCQKWQGRIYSLDGTTGEIDGRKYVPLETATEVYWHSKRTGKDYPNGLFSYNCRHKAEPYHRGQNIETIPDDVIERTRGIEEQQRKMEREYRELRSDELNLRAVAKATGNNEILKQAQALRKRSIQLRKNYVRFSEKNGMVYYPERLKVVEGEYSAPVMPSSPAPAPQAKTLTSAPQPAIIEKAMKLDAQSMFAGTDYASAKNYKEAQKIIDRVNEMSDEANPRAVELFSKFSERVRRIKATAHWGKNDHAVITNVNRWTYAFDSVDVKVPKYSGADGEIRTSVHEWGHLIDIATGKGSYVSESFQKLKDYFNNYKQPASVVASLPQIIRDLHDEQFELGKPFKYTEDEEWRKLRSDLYRNYSSLTYSEYKAKEKEMRKIEKQYQEQKDEAMRNGFEAVSDIYDALNNGALGDVGWYGHGTKYYRRVENKCSETFANYMSLAITSPKYYAVLKDNLPDLCDIMDEFIEEMLKK